MRQSMKKLILVHVPTSICNFRCQYCYLSQRDENFQGVQPVMKYSPEQIAQAFSYERIGGYAYFNFCAEGETLLTKDIDKYIKAIVEQGHYAEIVTNLTVTPMLERILCWDESLLKRIEFKCSFHYLELKKRKLLDTFVENINKIKKAGASFNIEITPPDDLIPYIDEVKEFSLRNFKALPHLSIARDDRTKGIEYLTELSDSEYEKAWEQFDSEFWNYKRTIFGIPQREFCYAGRWSLYLNLETGVASQCYHGHSFGDIVKNPHTPIPKKPVGKCPIAHCYNGHMLLTLGLIPGATKIGYGDIRDRKCTDGSHWLQPELKEFFNSKLNVANEELSEDEKSKIIMANRFRSFVSIPWRLLGKMKE